MDAKISKNCQPNQEKKRKRKRKRELQSRPRESLLSCKKTHTIQLLRSTEKFVCSYSKQNKKCYENWKTIDELNNNNLSG